jgi:transposase-like protein
MGKPKKMKTNGKRRKPEQIIRLLRKAEADIAGGFTVEDVCRDIGVAVSTFHLWRKKYGNLAPSDAKRLKKLEEENARLKKMVAEMALDNAMLKDLAEGNF